MQVSGIVSAVMANPPGVHIVTGMGASALGSCVLRLLQFASGWLGRGIFSSVAGAPLPNVDPPEKAATLDFFVLFLFLGFDDFWVGVGGNDTRTGPTRPGQRIRP